MRSLRMTSLEFHKAFVIALLHRESRLRHFCNVLNNDGISIDQRNNSFYENNGIVHFIVTNMSTFYILF